MALSRETYKTYCKQYFRAMYDAGWSLANQVDVPECVDMCSIIRENINGEESNAYSSYCAYRNGLQQAQAQQVAQSTLTEQSSTGTVPMSNEASSTATHVPDKYTKQDGLMADERLEASQKHTIIMLLSDIAVSCRAIASALNANRDDSMNDVQ